MLVKPLLPSHIASMLAGPQSVRAQGFIDLLDAIPMSENDWSTLRRESNVFILEPEEFSHPKQKLALCLLSSLGSIAVHDLLSSKGSLVDARSYLKSSLIAESERGPILESLGLVKELQDELETKLGRYRPSCF